MLASAAGIATAQAVPPQIAADPLLHGPDRAGGPSFSMNGIATLMWYPWGRDLAFQVFERPR